MYPIIEPPAFENDEIGDEKSTEFKLVDGYVEKQIIPEEAHIEDFENDLHISTFITDHEIWFTPYVLAPIAWGVIWIIWEAFNVLGLRLW